ncbi:MAG TPA: acetyl-CoA carboxylase biotin carboxylase subunit, partial [Myxococcaceae bacterium]|nr:acetyl-CoA carboxylase biotin carboxylase subunit [Myxococcaceae bacterium]
VIIKAVAGGGGRGMRIAHNDVSFAKEYHVARGEAEKAFGNGAVYIEKPRHVEIQILADRHGGVVHLGERDCSLQRRHQKLIEESPSPGLTPEIREAMGDAAKKLARAAGYANAGTVEFLLDRDGDFYFIEVNTRIQVEHPVTEMVTGVDIVREQIKLADGQPLRWKQEDVKMRGHAIECRINAEDPVTFAPSPGKITGYSAPGGYGVRVDSAAYENYVVRPNYDSLLAKLIAYAEDRPTAIRRMQRALSEYIIEGIKTNTAFHRAALAEDSFVEGSYDTRFVERLLASETGSHRLKKAIEETP